MRHLTLALVAILVTPTALAQDIFFESRIDPITDLNTSFMGFSTVDFVRLRDNHGHFGVRCAGDGFEVFVGTEAWLGTGKPIPVVYRFDSQEAVNAAWPWSANGYGAFVPADERITILRQILSSSRFVWRATRFDDTTRTLIFDIPSDLRDYIDRLGCVTLD
jgi:hypothetical protein